MPKARNSAESRRHKPTYKRVRQSSHSRARLFTPPVTFGNRATPARHGSRELEARGHPAHLAGCSLGSSPPRPARSPSHAEPPAGRAPAGQALRQVQLNAACNEPAFCRISHLGFCFFVLSKALLGFLQALQKSPGVFIQLKGNQVYYSGVSAAWCKSPIPSPPPTHTHTHTPLTPKQLWGFPTRLFRLLLAPRIASCASGAPSLGCHCNDVTFMQFRG